MPVFIDFSSFLHISTGLITIISVLYINLIPINHPQACGKRILKGGSG